LKDPWNYGISFGFSGYVRRLIDREKPDYIVVNKLLFWTSLVTILLALAGKRVTVLTDAFVGITWWPRGKIPQIAAAIYAWTFGWLILRSAERIVTFHPQPPELLQKLGIMAKTRVIPTGIDPEPYGHRSKELAHGDGEVTISYVGRLESVKGVDDFLAAVVPLKKQYPKLIIQVAGWYAHGHPLVSQYEREVIFLGLQKDIPSLLAKTDIFVLPSYSEGLSNALMEAMASRCACIASDVGGNRFLIQNDVSGFLFPAGDREALAAHIRRLLDDPHKRKALGESARKRIEEQFSWNVVGEQYRRLFEE
jgi:glycosyltransferase involved in cell wall biosynthesis